MSKFKVGMVVMTTVDFPLGVVLHGVITKVSKICEDCYNYQLNNGKIGDCYSIFMTIAEKWLIQV